ncbi:putative ribonuclease H-like domain-containing protein, partial [Tanacetum coccineum]
MHPLHSSFERKCESDHGKGKGPLESNASLSTTPKSSYHSYVRCHLLGLKRLQGFLELLLLSTDSIKLPLLVEVSTAQTQESGTLVTKMSVPVTAEEKANEKNDVKARSLLLMTLPNEHQLTFSQYPDGKPQQDDTGFVDSGCSMHMTGNIAYLSDFKEFDGGYVTFRGGAHGGRISCKGTLKTDSLDFEDFPDESQILLKIPRKDNMYSFDMKNIVPKESLTCRVAKATFDESMLWHRRLGHINFKNLNKLVKDNLVRGLSTKHFENDQTYVACLKGKQHRASCKSKVLNPITKPLFMLHMDLFGPTFVSSLMHKYCLVATDDYSRFTRVFFLTTKDETSEIIKNFIKEIENLVDKKVKIIRSDNGTEFKNKVMDDFCREKGIKREYNIARTPQQNGMAERRNRALIEATEQLTTGTITNESTGTQGELNVGTSTKKEEISQDCIMMPIWKDTSYFDSPSEDVDNGEPKSSFDDQKQVEDGPDNENDEKDKYEDDNSPKEVNTAGQHVNTASPEVNTCRFKLNTVDPLVNTASSYDQDSPKDLFTMGASHTLEATHVEFFSDEDEPEVDLGNI